MLMSSKPAINDKLQNACEQFNALLGKAGFSVSFMVGPRSFSRKELKYYRLKLTGQNCSLQTLF